MRKFLTILFMTLLAYAAGYDVGWADTSTLTFTAACGGSGTADDGASWTVTSDASESTYDSTKGIHYGTGKAEVSYLTLTTSSINGTITEIIVNASGAKGTSAKLNVKVGNEAFGSEKSLTSTATTYTFTGSATGDIEVKLSQTSAKIALYVKSIEVTYTTEGGSTETVATPTFDPAAGTVAYGTTVTLSTTTAGASIYYTTDGTAPTTSSTLFSSSSPIVINSDMTIKAIAVKDGISSTVAEAAYTVTPADNSNKYQLVTSTSQMESGKKYLIVSAGSYNANQHSFNYKVAATGITGTFIGGEDITIASDNTITLSSSSDVVPYIMTLSEGKWSFTNSKTNDNLTFTDPTSSGGTVGTGTTGTGFTLNSINSSTGAAELSLTNSKLYFNPNSAAGDASKYRFTTYKSPQKSIMLFKQVAEEEKAYTIDYAKVTGGSATGPEGADANETVIVTLSANSGYAPNGITVTGVDANDITDNGDGTYSFTVPDNLASGSTITVTPSFAQTYEITYVADPAAGGSITGPASAIADAPVTFNVAANNDYSVSGVAVSPTATVTDNGNGSYSFTMSAAATTVTATFAKIPHTFTVVSANGSVSGLPENAVSGTSISFSVNPDDGYIVSNVVLSYATTNQPLTDDNGTYSFTMPASDVTITVTYEEGGSTPPTPELVVDPEVVNIRANAGETATATFSVLGSDLTDEVKLTLTDANSCFSINPATISVADAEDEDGAEVTITFVAPSTGGNYSATVTVASAGATSATVTLNGKSVVPELIVDPNNISISTSVNQAKVGTFTVLGSELKGDVSLTLSDPRGFFSIDDDKLTITITKAEAEESANVNVTYSPTHAGSHSATVTISSPGLEDIVVSVNGTASNQSISQDPISLYHETFGDVDKARDWDNSYSVKSGVEDVYEKVDYSITNARQSKNTMGRTASALFSGQGKTGVFIVGPLAVKSYEQLKVSNYFGMSSGTWDPDNSFMKLSYSVDNTNYTEVTRVGSDPVKAVSANNYYAEATYSLPTAAETNTLYLKFEFYCYQTNKNGAEIGQAYFDEVELQGVPKASADETHTLADMVADGTLGVGDSYAIADGNLLAVALSADGKTLFCKDDNGYKQKQSANGRVDYMAECGFGEYDQSNWVALTSESALNSNLVGSYLNGVSGKLSDVANPSLALTSAPTADDSGNTYTLNQFIPTSLMGNSVVEIEIDDVKKEFFFVTPKPMEVAIVTWAWWNGVNFVAVPKTTYTKDGVTRTMNPYDLPGAFTVNTKYLENWLTTLTENDVYKFTAVITREGGSSSAPGRLKSATEGGYGIYPLSAPEWLGHVNSNGTVTGITGVNGNGAAVKSVRVYNVAGVEQRELQTGVNIVVTTYTDGTRSTAKVLR